LDEFYRGCRIAIKETETGWTARVTTARGPKLPVAASAEAHEGAEACLQRAQAAVDRYLAYIAKA
jgi:hypothetical protein